MIVNVPGQGQVNFPDTMSEDEVVAAIQKMEADARNVAGREALGNPLEAGVVGVGRFGTEVGQGIKQMGLMAGEVLGLADEGAADEYTKKINEEKKYWDQATKGAGAEDVGYYGAMLAPAMLAPQAGVLGTGAIAGLEAGVLPTPEADIGQKAAQVGTGALLGGGARALEDVVGAGVGAVGDWNRARKAGNIDPDVAALSAGRGVDAPPDVYSPNQMKSGIRDALDLPFLKPGRAGAKADSERVLREMAAETDTPGTIQDAYIAGRTALKRENSDMWDETMSMIGDAPTSNAMLGKGFASLKRELLNEGLGKQEIEMISDLWSQRPKGWMSVADLHKYRAKFGNKLQAKWAKEGLDVSVPKRIYGLLSEEMKAGTERQYGQRGLDLLEQSNKATQDMYTGFNTSGASVKEALGMKLDDNKFYRAATGASDNKRQALKRIIAEDGATAVQNRIINDVLEEFAKNPQAAARRIAKLDPSIKEFFGEDMAAQLRGLEKLMKTLPTGDNLSSLATSGLAGSAAALVTGGSLPAMAGAYGLTAALMRRRDVQAMLQKLSKTNEKDPLYKALVDQLKSTIAVGAGVEGSKQVPQIEIRNGATQ
jgi:hypothetical protein